MFCNQHILVWHKIIPLPKKTQNCNLLNTIAYRNDINLIYNENLLAQSRVKKIIQAKCLLIFSAFCAQIPTSMVWYLWFIGSVQRMR
jgi:hypothetical protein